MFFSERFLLPRPVLRALLAERPSLLLVDEVDKADPEFEAFLLEVLADSAVTIPELGTLRREVPAARGSHLERGAGALGRAEASVSPSPHRFP